MVHDETSDGPQASGSVAVVIPCHRQAHFLGEAIASALAQRHPVAEVIVVDDGSPDDTREVVARFAVTDPRVRCLSQENRGLSAARNAGLRAAASELVLFLDADDRLLPDALVLGVPALAAHTEWAFVYGRHRLVTSDGATLGEDGLCVEGDPYAAMLRNNVIAMLGSVLFRRRVVEAVGGFDEGCRAAEDYDLYLRILREHPAGCHGATIVEYRRYPGSMSTDAALLLEAVTRILEAQQRWTASTPYEAARRAGLRTWRARYGRALAAQALRSAARGDVRPVLRHPGTVLRHAPAAAVNALRRRITGA